MANSNDTLDQILKGIIGAQGILGLFGQSGITGGGEGGGLLSGIGSAIPTGLGGLLQLLYPQEHKHDDEDDDNPFSIWGGGRYQGQPGQMKLLNYNGKFRTGR